MTMQHKRGAFDFDGKVSLKGIEKLERIASEQRIKIGNLAEASRRIVADHPELCSWYCLKVISGRERAVEKHLYEENVEALVPTKKGKEKCHRGRVIPAPSIPVMPGYVLVQCATKAQCFIALRGVKDVIGIIGGGERPYPIPSEFIEKFKRRAVRGDYDYRVSTVEYVVGQALKVTDGPFAGFTGLVTDFEPSKNRVTVEVMMFGRSTPLELDIAQVEES
ncbi:transcription termination/antitermination NusG family protein [Rhizobium sp. AN80A]|uniref:transcription termination/antitermination protein NusG n=1 Tax=Rhizobium sp. AN80A TaxID=3040673 RepID=UPI0024B3B2CC|nr:transcription termination/antitermination NusG family protein [Rhizobium sp. AN80A]